MTLEPPNGNNTNQVKSAVLAGFVLVVMSLSSKLYFRYRFGC